MKKPTSAKAYAKQLYMWDRCTGAYSGQYNDFAVIDMRIRAFEDGANWAKRQARKQSTSFAVTEPK